jgi:hypothetical protein
MPARQATPGPSAGIILQSQQTNARKRSKPEGEDEDLNSNKIKKVKEEQSEEIVVIKDKKKRRKRKRKSSIVVPATTAMEPGIMRVRSQSGATATLVPVASSAPPDAPPDSQPAVGSAAKVVTEQDAVPNLVSHIFRGYTR